jgi:hypothetical protein
MARRQNRLVAFLNPRIEFIGHQDRRHPVVQRPDLLVRVRGDDGEGLNGVSLAFPTLPQAGEIGATTVSVIDSYTFVYTRRLYVGVAKGRPIHLPETGSERSCRPVGPRPDPVGSAAITYGGAPWVWNYKSGKSLPVCFR